MQHRGGDIRLERRQLPVAVASVVGGDPHDAVGPLSPRLDLRDRQPRIDNPEVGVVLGASQVRIRVRVGHRADQAGRHAGHSGQGGRALQEFASLEFHKNLGGEWVWHAIVAKN